MRDAPLAPGAREERACIGDPIEREVGAQHLMDHPLRLIGDDDAARADCGREIKGVGPYIGADVEHHRARLHELAEEIDLTFGEFTVKIEGAPDIGVLGMVEHQAVARGLEPHLAIVENSRPQSPLHVVQRKCPSPGIERRTV